MTDLQGQQAAFRELGVEIVGLAVDPPQSAERLRQDLGVRFPLLCDTAREVVQLYDAYNRKERGGIAKPATFVVERDATVSFRSLDGVAGRVGVDTVLEFLRQRASGPTPAGDNEVRRLLVPGVWDSLASPVRKYLRRD